MYFYQYLNKSFQIYGMIELFADEWKYIFNKHFSKKTFSQYLTEKKINLDQIGQKQILLSSMKQYLGNIYLINKLGKQEKISENVTPSNITMNTGFNENITKNNNLKNIYQNFMNSLKSLVNNSYDLQNIETIMNYLSLDIINGISVFIIETSNLNYCLNGKKQLIETDIISSDNISESKKYSFINDAFCKYFKVQNIEYIPKVFLFTNKKINQKRNNLFIIKIKIVY